MESEAAAGSSEVPTSDIICKNLDEHRRSLFVQFLQTLETEDKQGKAKLEKTKVLEKLGLLKELNISSEITKLATDVSYTLENEILNYRLFVSKLSELVFNDLESANIAKAKTELSSMRNAILASVSGNSSNEMITAAALKSILSSEPINLEQSLVDSVLRHCNLQQDNDAIYLLYFLRMFCPMLDQSLFTNINAKLIEKYQSLPTAFSSLSKQKGKISLTQLRGLLIDLDLGLKESELAELISLADSDGSGGIELDEFNVIFGAGDKQARQRQENFDKMTKSMTQSMRNSSQKVHEKFATYLKANQEKVLEALRAKDEDKTGLLKVQDFKDVIGELPERPVQAFEIAKIIAFANQQDKEHVNYEALIEWFLSSVSKATTLAEAQNEIASSIKLRHPSLLEAFSALDLEANNGQTKGRLSVMQLSRALNSIRLFLSGTIVAKLIKMADSDGDGWVNYADFLNLLGEEASTMRSSVNEPSSPSKSVAKEMKLREESGEFKNVESSDGLEEEIRMVLKGKFDTMITAFRSFDKNNDGKISREEMREGLSNLNLGLKMSHINEIIKRADADGSGEIDYNEFRHIFQVGKVADAKRDGARKGADKDKDDKPRRAQVPVEKRIPDEELPPVSEEAENFMWSSLQSKFDSFLGAFYFLKGRKNGQHADLISEPEFVSGLLRLELTEKIRDAKQEDEINEIFQLANALTTAQKKEILTQSKDYTEEAARKFLLKYSPDDQRILDGPQPADKQGTAKESIYRNHQAIAIFRAYNESKSGWLTQGEFVKAQSRWSRLHGANIPSRPVTAGKQQKPSVPVRSGGSPKRPSSAASFLTAASPPRSSPSVRPREVKPFLKRTDPFASSKPQQGGRAADLSMDPQGPGSSLANARKEEVAILASKLKHIRSLEDKLRLRQKEVDMKGLNLELQETKLAKREAVLLQREMKLEEAAEQLRAQHEEVESMKQQLAKQMKEVESRALWLKEQKAVFEQREQLLQDQSQRLEKIQKEGGAHRSSGQQAPNIERLEGLYRSQLDQANHRAGAGNSGMESQKAAVQPKDVLRGVSKELHREMDTIGGRLKKVEDLLSSVKNV